jgi:uncharacterized damage-inducible protein DinB
MQPGVKIRAMTVDDDKADLIHYLREARGTILWKIDGLSEYDLRRPMTLTGTNLLGLLKHLANVEACYFGVTFGRPFSEPMVWTEKDPGPTDDLRATRNESKEDIIELYGRACAHADSTIAALNLDAVGQVPHWGGEDVTLHKILVHVIAETDRHTGHADIIRELIDGSVGAAPHDDNMTPGDDESWRRYHDELEALAQEFKPTARKGRPDH